MGAINYDKGLTCALGVKDLHKSLDWYDNMLGFKQSYCLDDMGWAEIETPIKGVNVGLSQVEDLKVEGGATLTFGVTDIDAARGHLESQGVKFDGDTITIEGMVKLATFFDPDGNKLMFYQSLGQP